jgi:hypothetical protein
MGVATGYADLHFCPIEYTVHEPVSPEEKNTMNPSVDAASSHKVSLWRVAIISGHPQWVPLVFLQGTT